jgi:hypothetical protein
MRLIAALTIVAAISVNDLQAQPAAWQPSRLTPGWVFTPTIMAGGLWDSNVTVRNQGDVFLQEWVATVSPAGELDYNGRQFRFNAGYAGTLEAYRRFAELNRYDQRGRVSGDYRATARLQIEGRASYVDTPSTDRLELGTLPFVDIGGRSFDSGGGFKFSQSARTTIEGSYRFQQLWFDHDPTMVRNLFLAGGYAHGPVARVSYALTRRFAAGGEWQYQKTTLGDGLQRFDVQSALGDLRYTISSHTSVSGGAGAAYAHDPVSGFDAWGPSVRASLSHQLNRTGLLVSYNRSFVPAFSLGGLTGSQELSVTARTPLTRDGRWTTQGGITYSRAEPIAALGLTFQLDSWWTNASVAYQASRWLRTEGFVTTMHQTSSVRGNFDRTRIGFQFVTFKPVRIQ